MTQPIDAIDTSLTKKKESRKLPRLTVMIHAGGYDRVHYALVLASAAAALDQAVTLFWTGRSIQALCHAQPKDIPAWHHLGAAEDGSLPAWRDAAFAARGIATFEQLLMACITLDVEFHVCDMAIRGYGFPSYVAWRPDVPLTISGVTAVLAESMEPPIFI